MPEEDETGDEEDSATENDVKEKTAAPEVQAETVAVIGDENGKVMDTVDADGEAVSACRSPIR